MLLKRKASLMVLRYALTLLVTIAPIVIFTRLFRAEGPLLLLYAGVGVCVSFVFFAFSGFFKRPFLIFAAVIALVFVFAVLVQVNVARRSLAEAWLELAREGRAFGFFSFFSAEVYALFCLPQAILLCMKKYRLFFTSAVTTNALCAGIILGNTALLALSFCSFFLLLLVSEDSWTALRARLVSVAYPAIAGVLLAASLAAFGGANPDAAPLVKYPDLSSFFARLAPSFPLLRDVPGYGVSIGGGEMPSSIFLSDRSLFHVQGEPSSVHYLASERYAVWNGVLWLEDPNEGRALPYAFFGEANGKRIPTLRLNLVEDFYAAVPIELETQEVLLSPDVPEKIKLTANRGLRFEPSARRGLEAALINGEKTAPSAHEAELPQYSAPASLPSARISALAAELQKKARSTDAQDTDVPAAERKYIQTLLDYFSTGFTYSLETGKKAKGETTIEHFLFTEKKGFCLYYASAFVLLAREFGLPARMAEGFRVSLDEKGSGTISGNNAHAWPEVYLDGDWRIFEPTPPFARENPFAWSRSGDRNARRQLEALFGSEPLPNGEKPDFHSSLLRFVSRNQVLIVSVPALAFLAILSLMYRLNRGTRKLRRKAARLVRKYRKQGIMGPEITGWLVWSGRAAEMHPDSGAEAVAEEMIRLTFSPGGETVLTSLRYKSSR